MIKGFFGGFFDENLWMDIGRYYAIGSAILIGTLIVIFVICLLIVADKKTVKVIERA